MGGSARPGGSGRGGRATRRSSSPATTCTVPPVSLSGGSLRAICSPTSTRSSRALSRAAAGRALDGALVDTVLARAPFAPAADQAQVIRDVTSNGHGVETGEALAGCARRSPPA
jgi:hypothetical protein